MALRFVGAWLARALGVFGLKGFGNACKRWDGDILTGCNPTFASLLGYLLERGKTRITSDGWFLGSCSYGLCFQVGIFKDSTSCQAWQSYLRAGTLLARKG